MYCNSCLSQIATKQVTYCSQCGVPLHKECANNCRQCGKELCDTCFVDNHYKCEECFKPNNTFACIRRSHIEQYAACPYPLYLELILGITPKMGAAAELGILTHELLDKMGKGEIKLNRAKNLLTAGVDDWNAKENDPYSIITMDLLENGMICLENFEKIKKELNRVS